MDKKIYDIKINKNKFAVVSLTDSSDDKAYWIKREPEERLKHMEILRRINYGHSATSRLQRFFEITER